MKTTQTHRITPSLVEGHTTARATSFSPLITAADIAVILLRMTHKVGAKGQVVIPKAIRAEIGIRPGDEVIFKPAGKEVRIHRLADEREERRKGIEALRGTWAEIPGLSLKDLEAERQEERARGLLGDSP